MTNKADIVDRLRGLKWKVHCEMRGLVDDETAYEAADTITTLRKQLAKAIESRRAETLGSVHESAVAESHLPND